MSVTDQFICRDTRAQNTRVYVFVNDAITHDAVARYILLRAFHCIFTIARLRPWNPPISILAFSSADQFESTGLQTDNRRDAKKIVDDNGGVCGKTSSWLFTTIGTIKKVRSSARLRGKLTRISAFEREDCDRVASCDINVKRL